MPHALDTQNMEAIILDSPAQFMEGWKAAAGLGSLGGPFTNIRLAGMGGSWMAAALVREAGLSQVPIHIHRTYGLPEKLRKEGTLVIASTFSGDTAEVISAYEAAREGNFALVGIASKGELPSLCGQHGTPFVRIPAVPLGMQPRCATGYTVGILTRLLVEHGLATEGAEEAIRSLGGALEASMDTARQLGKNLVPALSQATPVVYAACQYETVARIWKIKFNENAKTPAFWNVFPELDHNELVGWTDRRRPFHLVLLGDASDDARILARFKKTAKLLREHEVYSSEIPIEGGSHVEKVFRTLLIGDWASYELALELKHDPTPVDLVEEFKDRMKAGDP